MADTHSRSTSRPRTTASRTTSQTVRLKRGTSGLTDYSTRISGNERNHRQAVRFDLTDGYVGITQYDRDGTLRDRVLLSPEQMATLLGFVLK